MAKIQTGQPIDLQLMSQAEAKVGDYKWSHLEATPFGDEHLGEWMLCDGQSAVGTAFESLTGESVVPNALSDGTFIRQAKAGRSKGSFETDKTAPNGLSANSGGSHNHHAGTPDDTRSEAYGHVNGASRFSSWGSEAYRTSYANTSTDGSHGHSISGDSETAPKNIALNLYVKVNY